MPVYLWLLLLALAGSGDGQADIVSLLPAKEYFKARNIEPSIDKLVALAAEPPTSGKKQIAQLLALRQLAADAATVKKSPELDSIRTLFAEIADGKKASDPAGFAAEYARRALIAIAGGKQKASAAPGWKEGAAWIPDGVTFLAGVNPRGASAIAGKPPNLAPLFAIVPKAEMEGSLDGLDSVGNFRIDRVVFGLRELPKNEIEYFVRISGKLNIKWSMAMVKAAKVSTRATKAGPKIHVIQPLHADGKGPALALVGDRELLIAGVESISRRLGPARFARPADTAAVDKMLALASEPGKNMTQGTLNADLAKVPADAVVLAVGKIPDWVRTDAPVAMPTHILLHGRRLAKAIELHAEARMDDAKAAQKLADVLEQARNKIVTELEKNSQPAPGISAKPVIELLQSVRVRLQKNVIHVRLLASPEAIVSVPALLFIWRSEPGP